MLVNCAAYQNGRKLGDIRRDEIRAYLTRPDCFVWVALKDAEPAELEEMRAEFDLHELAIEDAHRGHQRPKIEEYGDSLFAVLHTAEVAGEDLKIGEVDVFVGDNYVLSVRNRTERGFADVRARCEREPELLRFGSGYVLYALLDSVVDHYFPVLDSFECELEAIEERIFAGTATRESIEALYVLKQKIMKVKHATDPLHESVGKLYGGRVPHICAGMSEYFRDVYDHLGRLNQTIESIRDMVGTATSVNLALIALAENETTKRLAAYAALVASPTMVAGIYGMNFKHMPELDWQWGYPYAIGLMVVIDLYLWFRFRKSGWL